MKSRSRSLTLAWVLVLLVGVSVVACSPAFPPPPDTNAVEIVDTIHDVSFSDPYRWLENQESAETRLWIDRQNAYAEQIVGESALREELRERLRNWMGFDDIGSPRRGGDFEYFTMRKDDQEVPVIYRRPAPPEGEPRRVDPEGDYEVVIDPHEMASDHTTRVDILSISSDGKLLAYSIRDGGQDETEVRVWDVKKGTDLVERLPRALYSGVAFNKADEGLYYTRRSRETGARVFFHELGSDVQDDVELFGEGYDPRSFINAREVDDGHYLVFTVNHGWARSELHYKDLKEDAPVRAIVDGAAARFVPKFHGGLLYVRTNLDAPNNRLVAIDLEDPAPDEWKEVVPEQGDVMQDFSVIEEKLYVTYLRNVSTWIKVYDLDGTPVSEISVADFTTADITGGPEGKAFLTTRSFVEPPTTYLLDLESGERQVWDKRNIDFDADGIEVSQVWYESRDQTKVPMFVVHREGLALDGSNPTLLYGYGGFNAALTPRFDVMGAAWVERGGVFALANLRGGSEFGERWHRAGMLENKQNVFDDFIAAAEWLISNNYTRPERLAIRGASNGGLLVATTMTQRPDLFRAVLCGFPDLDMVRFYTFTKTNNLPALLEYGDASIPEQFEFLRKYSPYQAVRNGTKYPAVMLTSGDLDTRVPPLQARKLTARLQAATSSGLPVILRYHPKAGHAAGRGVPLSQRVEDTATELTFLLNQLGAGGPS